MKHKYYTNEEYKVYQKTEAPSPYYNTTATKDELFLWTLDKYKQRDINK